MPSPYSSKPRVLPAAGNAQLLPYAAQPTHSSNEPEELLPMHHYLWLLRRAGWKIVAAVFCVTALTALLCYVVTPVYEATARITVDNKVPTTALGQEGGPESTSDVEEFLTTEMDLIQSDAVLRPVAEQFPLLPQAKPGPAAVTETADV